jgi:hypothetical protein
MCVRCTQGLTSRGDKWTFAIRPNAKLVTDRKTFKGYFGWAPVYYQNFCWRIAVMPQTHRICGVVEQLLPLPGSAPGGSCDEGELDVRPPSSPRQVHPAWRNCACQARGDTCNCEAVNKLGIDVADFKLERKLTNRLHSRSVNSAPSEISCHCLHAHGQRDYAAVAITLTDMDLSYPDVQMMFLGHKTAETSSCSLFFKFFRPNSAVLCLETVLLFCIIAVGST